MAETKSPGVSGGHLWGAGRFGSDRHRPMGCRHVDPQAEPWPKHLDFGSPRTQHPLCYWSQLGESESWQARQIRIELRDRRDDLEDSDGTVGIKSTPCSGHQVQHCRASFFPCNDDLALSWHQVQMEGTAHVWEGQRYS